MAAESRFQHRTRSSGPNYETRDASAAWIFGLLGLLVLCIAASQVFLGGFHVWLSRRPTPSDSWAKHASTVTAASHKTTLPPLQIDPPNDLMLSRAHEQEVLNSYGWADRSNQFVRLPIERAMSLLAERGLPFRQSAGADKVGPSSYDLVQKRSPGEIKGPGK